MTRWIHCARGVARWAWRRRLAALGLPLVLAVPTAPAGAAGHAIAARSPQGVVTYAEQPGEYPNYIFPITPAAYDTLANLYAFQTFLYVPLYANGYTGTPTTDFGASLGYPPLYSNGGRTVTIRLHHYMWSDGTPVTSRDIQFWQNEVDAAKANYGGYVPGASHYPQNVVRLSIVGPTVIRLTFNGVYNRAWLLGNELSQISALPQQAWDRTTSAGPVGNYDRTPSGAAAVYRFLAKQAATTATYVSNPLWHVVDGAFRLSAYDAGTGAAAFTANPQYAGPSGPHIRTLREVPFTSDQAEFDALRSGAIDYGYLPSQDRSQATYFEGHGYRVAPWYGWTISYIPLNLTSPQVGAILRQVYVRQALQSLIDQPQYIRDIYRGQAVADYGPVPPVPRGPINAPERTPPFPYRPSVARQLLSRHGWRVVPGGTSTCVRPGTGPLDCGAGVRRGAALTLQLDYGAGVVTLAQTVEAMKSAESAAGIVLTLRQKTNEAIFGELAPCQRAGGPGCGWEMTLWSGGYTDYTYPSGEALLATGAGGNPGAWSDPRNDRLINATLVQPGIGPMLAWERYVMRQLPFLFMPLPPYQVSVIRRTLAGALPQNPILGIQPVFWSMRG